MCHDCEPLIFLRKPFFTPKWKTPYNCVSRKNYYVLNSCKTCPPIHKFHLGVDFPELRYLWFVTAFLYPLFFSNPLSKAAPTRSHIGWRIPSLQIPQKYLQYIFSICRYVSTYYLEQKYIGEMKIGFSKSQKV